MLDAVARPMAATPRDAGTGADENANQEGADHRWVIVAFAAVFIGWFLARDSTTPAVTLAPEIGLFGLLYVLAQAIERVLEPIVSLDPFKTVFERRRNRAAAASRAAPEDESKKQDAVAAQADIKRWKANRAVVIWALATVIGMWVSSRIGVYLLDIVIETADGQAGPDRTLDVAVTGLAIGGGTKPLHDLITRIQAAATTADTEASKP